MTGLDFKSFKCDCETLRVFHSKRNWLGKGTIYRIQTPYSSVSTCCACSLPITCLIAFISWIIAISNGAADSSSNDYTVVMKDANPHHRLPAAYYEHFYETLHFGVRDSNRESIQNSNFTLNLYQYYESQTDERNWDCADKTQENPRNVDLTMDNNYTSTGLLCYYGRKHSVIDPIGLYLCRNDDKYGNQLFGDILVDIASKGSCDMCNDWTTVIQQHWEPYQSITITLQLWITYSWSDNEGNPWATSPKWRYNTFEIKSVEYDNQQFKPFGAERCYGIKVLMDRSVYEIEDGYQLWSNIAIAVALFGGAWSFILIVHSGGAVGCEYMFMYCCKQKYEKDVEFAIKFNQQQDDKFKQMEDTQSIANQDIEMINETTT